jgi:hypothetical protein
MSGGFRVSRDQGGERSPGGAQTRRGERPEGRLTTDSQVRELRADEGLEAEVTGRGRQTRAGERPVSNGKGALASDEEAVAARRGQAPERATMPWMRLRDETSPWSRSAEKAVVRLRAPADGTYRGPGNPRDEWTRPEMSHEGRNPGRKPEPERERAGVRAKEL